MHPAHNIKYVSLWILASGPRLTIFKNNLQIKAPDV